MAITRSSVADRSRSSTPQVRARVDARTPELLWLLIASGLVCAGLTLVYLGKTHTMTTSPAPLDLRTVERREQLLPVLDMFRDAKEPCGRHPEGRRRRRALSGVGLSKPLSSIARIAGEEGATRLPRSCLQARTPFGSRAGRPGTSSTAA